MQAVKNLLHKNDHESTSATHNSSSNPGYNTTSSGVGHQGTTGDLTSSTAGTQGISSAAPTNTAATQGTGLAHDRHADTAHGGAGRASHALDHSTGHDSSIAAKFDPTAANTTHDHKHLDHVTHRDVRHVETEEVLREREVDRHIHHVQHHVQPVVDKVVQDEVHHTNQVPVTKIQENHSSTQEDRGLFEGLASQHKDSEQHRAKERTVVDLGERVHENVQHHVHHVTQPVVEQEVVDRHRIHTVIPVHQTTHEAPIIHKSSTHEPIAMDAFLSGGGKIGSGIKHSEAGVLNDGNCERKVDGVAEKLAADLHLGAAGSGTGNYTTGTTDGSRDSGKYVANDGEQHKTKIGQVLDNKNITS